MDAGRHAGGETRCHHPSVVNIHKGQKKRDLGNEKRLAAKEEADKLLSAGFIREA